jgi:SnoaL-like domain
MIPPAIARWEKVVEKRDFELLDQLLADDLIFESPIVYAPQVGRAAAKPYLIAAVEVLSTPKFRFVGRWLSEQSAVLELEATIEDITVNAVDIISWNSDDRITRFKVMARPLKAINALGQSITRQMAANRANS